MILSISSIYAEDLDESSDIISSIDDSNEFIKSDLSNSGSLADGETGFDEPITIGIDYEELSNLINNTIEGGVLELDKDYKFVNDSGSDSKKRDFNLKINCN